MSTFVFPATHFTFADQDSFVPTAVGTGSFGLVAQAGVSTLTYTYARETGTQAVISSALDFAGVMIDGHIFQDQSLNLFVENTRWTQDGETKESLVLYLGADTTPPSLFMVHLGGDPLPEFATPSDFVDFGESVIGSERPSDSHRLGPGNRLSDHSEVDGTGSGLARKVVTWNSVSSSNSDL